MPTSQPPLGSRDEVLHRFEFMRYLFNPAALRHSAILNFEVRTETEPVSFHYILADGRCQLVEGTHAQPDTAITIDYDLWLDMQAGHTGLVRLLVEYGRRKRLRIQGNQRLFFKLPRLFGGTLDEHFNQPDIERHPEPRDRHWHPPQRVLILSGSGRSKRQSRGYYFADLLAQGMAGIAPAPEIDLIHLRDLSFRECTGCFACWRNGGICVHDDDFARIIKPHMDACQLLVFAFPLYFYDFPPQLNHVLTRLFINDHPYFRWVSELNDVRHYDRRPYPFSLFLLGTGGVLDRKQFEIPVLRMQQLCRGHHIPYCGHLYRPTGMGILLPAARNRRVDEIEASLRQAGAELVTQGGVRRHTRRTFEQPLLTPAQLRSATCAFYDMLTGRFAHPLPAIDVPRSRFDQQDRSAP